MRRFVILLALLWSVTSAAAQTIVTLGDSVTLGTIGGLPQAASYPSQLSLLTGRTVLNYAVAGTTSEDARAWVGDVLAIAGSVSHVLVMYGANDALNGSYCPDIPPRVSYARYEENIRYLISQIRAHGAVPILLTPTPPDHYYTAILCPSAPSTWADRLSAYSAVIRAVGLDTGVKVVDLNATLLSWDSYLLDAIHPTSAGSTLIATKISQGAPELTCVSGDANGDGFVNGVDITYLLEYLFYFGPAPKRCRQ